MKSAAGAPRTGRRWGHAVSDAIEQIDFLAPAVLADPWDAYRSARAQAPVYRLPDTDIYMVTGYARVCEVLLAPEIYSNDFFGVLEGPHAADPEIRAVRARGWLPVNTLFTSDPPQHTRFRKLLSHAFSPARINRLEQYIAQVVEQLVAALAGRGECEFVAQFAVPLPVTVISDQIGVPRADLHRVKHWSDVFTARLGGMLSREQELAFAHDVVEFQHYIAARLEERRAQPGEDLLSDLVHARVAGERPLDTAELLNIVQQLLVAGNATTTHALAEGLLVLLEQPHAMAFARAHPERMGEVVEELMRITSVTASMWRVVKRDTRLGDVDIPAGATVLLRYAAANHDETVFADARRFDPERPNLRSHLAFGRGVHYCLGAMLARKEITIALRSLLAGFRDIALACDPAAIRRAPNILLRGPEALPLRLRPA